MTTRWSTASITAAMARRRWKLLRDGIEERFVNLDSDLFPDGGYTIRVVASDAPSHSPEDTLTGESYQPAL